MIVVDTSVWISALRSTASPEAAILNGLIDADEIALPLPVRIELLSGASVKDRVALRRSLSALPIVAPTDETWNVIDDWIDRVGRRGQRFGFGDLLIGALAHELGALVWSLDADFRRMKRIGLIDLYEL